MQNAKCKMQNAKRTLPVRNEGAKASPFTPCLQTYGVCILNFEI
jgi:hypothetical protein